jgi:hypothetical protein
MGCKNFKGVREAFSNNLEKVITFYGTDQDVK